MGGGGNPPLPSKGKNELPNRYASSKKKGKKPSIPTTLTKREKEIPFLWNFDAKKRKRRNTPS